MGTPSTAATLAPTPPQPPPTAPVKPTPFHATLSRPYSRLELVVVIAGVVALTIVAGLSFPRGWNWIVVAAAMTLFFLFLGRWICGRPLGILINERNLMSLSRLQMAAWTIVVLSAYLTMALQRVHAGLPKALEIAIDPWLWAAMGISTASLVGTPLLVDSKRQQQPSLSVLRRTAATLREKAADIEADAQGTLYANRSLADASLADIFEGDEVGNTAYMDLTKVQMFLITVIAVGSYCYAVYHSMFVTAAGELNMPSVSEGLVALLAVSHAGYLTAKGVDHTAKAEPGAQSPPSESEDAAHS